MISEFLMVGLIARHLYSVQAVAVLAAVGDSRLIMGSDDSGLLSTERLLEATTCAAMDFSDERESEASLVVGRL